MKKHKVAIVGSGALGSVIIEALSKELSQEYELLGILSGRIENALKLSDKYSCKAYKSLDEMIEDDPDYIIEAASPNIIKEIGIKILENGINLIPLSIGAFADKEFYKQIEQAAINNNSRVHLPAGAVGGFDVLSAAMLMEDVQVCIITEKSPESLNGAPYLEGRKLSEEKVEEVFSGSAKEAIELFPKNVNVAVATALATTGVDNTLTVIRSIPNLSSNKHEIQLTGDTIKVTVAIESIPSINNPKSSTLAAYSVIALLKNLVAPITF
jgi:aspartate dehydrogenase